jgi:EAL domain-containing protein (putative c-di-GMP-specific phosphodiesterase class I)
MPYLPPRFARRGSLLFLAGAICWIVFSNQLGLALPLQPQHQHLVQASTEVIFAFVVAALLYWQLKRAERSVARAVDAARPGTVPPPGMIAGSRRGRPFLPPQPGGPRSAAFRGQGPSAGAPATAPSEPARLTQGMASAISRRVAVEAGLLLASLDDEFSLRLQPRWCVRTRRTLGAEALLRWTCPGLGAVSPAEFIPIAEQHPVIRELGRWTVVQVVRVLAGHQDRDPALQVSINLSACQLRDDDFPRFVAATVAEAGLPPACIQFELTETSLVCNLDKARSFLQSLRKDGFTVALDDFGVGYSSLAYLARFPVDVIKLDRSLVGPLPDDAASRIVASGIIDMAQRLGIRTVGECVETEAQRQVLAGAGCHEAQGWLVCGALPVEAFFQRHEGHAACAMT